MVDGQINEEIQLVAYCEKGFFPRSHFVPAFTNRTGQLQEWQRIENEHMKSILCTVEWAFGRNNLFFGLSDQKKQ